MPVLHARLGRCRVAEVVDARDRADQKAVVALDEQERVSEVARRVGHASAVVALDALDSDRVLECRVGHVGGMRLLQPLLCAVAARERHDDLHHHPGGRLLDPCASEAADETVLGESVDRALRVEAADGRVRASVERALENAWHVGGELPVAGARRRGEDLAEMWAGGRR